MRSFLNEKIIVYLNLCLLHFACFNLLEGKLPAEGNILASECYLQSGKLMCFELSAEVKQGCVFLIHVQLDSSKQFLTAPHRQLLTCLSSWLQVTAFLLDHFANDSQCSSLTKWQTAGFSRKVATALLVSLETCAYDGKVQICLSCDALDSEAL